MAATQTGSHRFMPIKLECYETCDLQQKIYFFNCSGSLPRIDALRIRSASDMENGIGVLGLLGELEDRVLRRND